MTEADQLRAALRRDLTAAVKARQTDTVAALRIAIAAIDNAEAVPAAAAPLSETSGYIAGGYSGAGAAEATRRRLDGKELRAILAEEVAEQTREADRYESLGRADVAQQLRLRARVLMAYL